MTNPNDVDGIITFFKRFSRDRLAIDSVATNLRNRGLAFEVIKPQYGRTRNAVFIIGGSRYFYQDKSVTLGSLSSFQNLLNAKSCPPPFYLVGLGDFQKRFIEADTDAKFDQLIDSIFSPLTVATIFNRMFRDSRIMEPYSSTIFECIESHYIGMDYTSTDSLVSVLEGCLRDIIGSLTADRPGTSFLKGLKTIAVAKALGTATDLSGCIWYPGKVGKAPFSGNQALSSDEYSFIVTLSVISDAINAFIIWLQDVLFKQADKTSTKFELNRHILLHYFSHRVSNSINFQLMIWALLGVVYMERMNSSEYDLFFPESNSSDLELASYFALLSARKSHRRQLIDQKFRVRYA